MRRYMHRRHSPFTGSLRQSVLDIATVTAAALGNSITDTTLSPVKRGWFRDARVGASRLHLAVVGRWFSPSPARVCNCVHRASQAPGLLAHV
jgi:hypothetical protein